uniref:MIF4G domain-containing protein n=1 Tax=Parastrongyloides trichosuri TaxID=131310 RepID=A0A0N4ZSU1_PARTI
MDLNIIYLKKYSSSRKVPLCHYREIILNVVLHYCKREDVKKIITARYERDILKSISSILSYIILLSTTATIFEVQANCLVINNVMSNHHKEIPKKIDDELIQTVGEVMTKDNIFKICKLINDELDEFIKDSTATTVCSLKIFIKLLDDALKHILRPNFYEEIQKMLQDVKKESIYIDFNFRNLMKFTIRRFGEWCNIGIVKSCAQDLLPIVVTLCFDNDKIISPMLDAKVLHCIEELRTIHDKKNYNKKIQIAFKPLYEHSIVFLENYTF